MLKAITDNRLKQIAAQEAFMRRCGRTLEGYIKSYGDPDLEFCSGSGGTLIYDADITQLNKLRQSIDLPTVTEVAPEPEPRVRMPFSAAKSNRYGRLHYVLGELLALLDEPAELEEIGLRVDALRSLATSERTVLQGLLVKYSAAVTAWQKANPQ